MEIKVLLDSAISRREVITSSAKLSAAVALSQGIILPFSNVAQASTPKTVASGETVQHSACLVNCGSRCPLKVIVKDDRIVRIEPEDVKNEEVFGEHQIRPCLRGRSSRWRVYSPDRIKYPMKRVGKRGEGKFKRISWDEATAFVASELKRVTEKYGREAIYYNYSTGAIGHNTQGTPAWERLLNISGGYLNYHNSYSDAQINVASLFSYGKYEGSHFTQIAHSDLVVLFGLNLSETRMSGGGQVEELRRALETSKARVIIIDPRYTDSVVTENAEWLPIRPTTDAALVAGIAHTLIAEKLIDEELVNKYCVGYDRSTLPESAAPNASYKDYVLGTGDDGIEKTPEWAADICGIPATRIRQLAREIATARACYICQGWGPQRHANGEQTVRAIQTLPVLTGHFGLPGTNSGNWPYGTPYGVPVLPVGTNPVKTSISFYLWTDAIKNPEKITAKTMGIGLKGAEQLKTGIKLIINQASNVLLNQHSEISRTRKIISDETLCETIIVIENHMTPSAKYADLLLPETSYLEAEDLIDSSYAAGSHNYMIAFQKAIMPMWEVRSTYDICADIAGHLGLREEYTEGRTQGQWAEMLYQQVREKRPYLPEWRMAKGMGLIDQGVASEKQSLAFADFRADAEANPLTTPSGKMELYSQALADLEKILPLQEYERIPAVPEFCVVRESHLNKELFAKYPLQLTGFHTKGHTHSTYTNVLMLREAVPDEVWINQLDAHERQLVSGDLVHVFNDRGVVEIPCKVTNRILPGVVAMPQGAWTRLDSNGVDVGGCLNTLTKYHPSALAKANPHHTNLVDIKRA
ncbi:DMSO/selenate family reductase complex A subunit [Citrobacter freundii]|uniref:DMSO/selenate family reductase complex A subunit n=1 Tax=Citrobacter freundii TaxID=546 RepID=UPI002AD8BF7E|nr:DMSO/selenate family reductase complex A subunit [Citrobacter freundii]EMB4690485.1 molybdopterin-dependent oxidoreductase [Citrobacter farmeri]MEB7949404.1 molybdopterin-dependent oxidoreductase [Citrobacter freundii]